MSGNLPKQLNIFLGIIFIFTICTDLLAGNLPRSRQGTLIESTSASEVMIRSTGIGYWEKGMSKKRDIDKFLTNGAELDARRAAVYFILFGGNDPLLNSADEKFGFAKIQEDFFEATNVNKYIAWEGQDFVSRVKKPIKKNKKYELHVEKIFKLNKRLIKADLIAQYILADEIDLASMVGMPFIMVLPVTKSGENPIDVLKNDPEKAHAAKAIEGFLTSRRYDVVVPGQQVEIANLNSGQLMLEGVEDDYSYQLALSIGSDIYITYSVILEDDKHNTKKAIVSINAFETTTARLLGAVTGYSPSSTEASLALIENAINDGVDKVLSRINSYWKDDLVRGIQYKLVVSISEDFDTEEAEEISFAFNDILDEITKNGKYQENIITSQTLDYLLWCDPQRFSKPNKLYQEIKRSFARKQLEGNIKKININRKLLLLRVSAD